MLSPNILITNFCNQNCSFCFASEEMTSKIIKKEMSFNDFKKVILKMKKDKKIKIVKLLGGEPTLHSRFQEIINFSLKYFPKVQLFTNGIISDSLTSFLESKENKIGFTFNVMTPGFLLNSKIRSLVINRIERLSKKARITLSFTFDMRTDMKLVFKTINQNVLNRVFSFRLGFANPICGEKNFYTFADFPKMGNQVVFVVSQIRKNNLKANISLNCGFTRCMFSDNQYHYLKKQKVILPGFGCFGKEASFDLQTDLTAFHCFPLSTKDRLATVKKSYRKINRDLIRQRFLYWSRFKQDICQKCPFYGLGIDKCPGPCIAFLINQEINNR